MKFTKILKDKLLPGNLVANYCALDTSQILDGQRVGIAIVDETMRISWQNPTIREWFGKTERVHGRFCYVVLRNKNIACENCPVIKSLQVIKANKWSFPKKAKKRYYQLFVGLNGDKADGEKITFEFAIDITKNRQRAQSRKTIINTLKSICSDLTKTNKKLNKNITSIRHMNKKIKSFNTNLVKKYKLQSSQIQFLKEEIDDISKMSKAMSSNQDLNESLSLITKLANNITHADGCILRLINKKDGILIPTASIGISDKYFKETSLKIGEGVAGLVAQNLNPISIEDITKDPRVKNIDLAKREELHGVMSVPAVFNDEILGVITVYFKTPRSFNEEDTRLLSNFASHAAIAIKETQMYQDIHVNYFNTIHTLVLAMEAKDPYTRGHSERVTQYSIQAAKKLYLPKHKIEILEFSSKVHDVGKIGISDMILNKPGKLTIAEKAIVELHPVKGAEMLGPLKFLQTGIPWVKHHHERFDGKGYPEGLKATRIPLEARIIACADSFDAMTSERPYRYRKMTFKEASQELKTNSGTQFDPDLVDVFLEIFSQHA